MRKLKMFDVDRSQIASIDFTFTGHRTDHRTTYSARNGPMPHSSKSKTRYTNCIVICLWADGKLWTPCMLFTKNPKFRLDRKSSARNDADEQYLRERLKHYKIDYDRIVYVPDLGKSQNYVSESVELLRYFF